METKNQISSAERERNWLPAAIATAAVVVILAVVLLLTGRHKSATANTQPDPYAASLSIANIVMSESSNLAGGKVTYIDGQIANRGTQTVTGITVQVIFRDYENKIAQNETMPLTLIRTREPYVDTEPVSAAPLQPAAQQEFRLIFDKVSPDWAGQTPELRILQVKTK